MKTTKRTQYALRGLLLLLNDKGNVLPLSFLSEEENIPFDYLEKIFSKLEKKGLIESKRGVNGGYYISQDAKEITLKDVFDAVDERVSIVDCLTKECPRDSNCKASKAWKKVNSKIEEAFSSIKLSEL